MRALGVKSIVVLPLSAGLLVLLAGQMRAIQAGQNPSGVGRDTSPRSESTITATNPSVYLIGSTDVLKVDVWKEAEVSGSVVVRPDGKISLPLIGDIQAAGLSPMKLAKDIADGLRKYISDPNVTVTVAAASSQRVYVVGEVNHPGPVNLLPNTTVLDALASAGGPAQFAHRKKIFVLRTENGKQVRYRFNYRAAIRGDLSQNIPLKPGDTIVVP